jgi:divalent metal cation (Fe/Co/Zn/Cd) transporter
MTTDHIPRLALALVAITAAYNIFEGVVAIIAGVAAGSITLVAFGADSSIEVAAALAVGYRLLIRDGEAGERAEARAMRAIGITFLLLAAAIVLQAVFSLAAGHEAESSRLGLTLLAVSALIMPLVSFAKLRTAARDDIPALAMEARETVACSYLSLTALVGVAAVAAFGWWWLDAATALLLVPWLVREGLESVRGEACFAGLKPCFCRPCFFGLRDCRPAIDGCSPVCC